MINTDGPTREWAKGVSIAMSCIGVVITTLLLINFTEHSPRARAAMQYPMGERMATDEQKTRDNADATTKLAEKYEYHLQNEFRPLEKKVTAWDAQLSLIEAGILFLGLTGVTQIIIMVSGVKVGRKP